MTFGHTYAEKWLSNDHFTLNRVHPTFWENWKDTKRKKDYEQHWPGDEEDLAHATVINGDIIKIKHGVTTVILRQRSSEIVIALAGGTNFVDGDFLRLLLDLENDVSMHFLPLHLHERSLAFLSHPHTIRRLYKILLNFSQKGQNKKKWKTYNCVIFIWFYRQRHSECCWAKIMFLLL